MFYNLGIGEVKAHNCDLRYNMARPFDDLVKRTTTKQIRQRAARRTQELLRAMGRSDIRKPSKKS